MPKSRKSSIPTSIKHPGAPIATDYQAEGAASVLQNLETEIQYQQARGNLKGVTYEQAPFEYSEGEGDIQGRFHGLKVNVPQGNGEFKSITFFSMGNDSLLARAATSDTSAYAITNNLTVNTQDKRKLDFTTKYRSAVAVVNDMLKSGRSAGGSLQDLNAAMYPIYSLIQSGPKVAQIGSQTNVETFSQLKGTGYDDWTPEKMVEAAKQQFRGRNLGFLVGKTGNNTWWDLRIHDLGQTMTKEKRIRQTAPQTGMLVDPQTGKVIQQRRNPIRWGYKRKDEDDLFSDPTVQQRADSLFIAHSPYANQGSTPGRERFVVDFNTRNYTPEELPSGFQVGTDGSVSFTTSKGEKVTINPGDYFSDQKLFEQAGERKQHPVELAREIGLVTGTAPHTIFYGAKTDRTTGGAKIQIGGIRKGSYASKAGTKAEIRNIKDAGMRYKFQKKNGQWAQKTADLLVHRPDMTDKEMLPWIEKMYSGQVFDSDDAGPVRKEMANDLLVWLTKNRDRTGMSDDDILNITSNLEKYGVLPTSLKQKSAVDPSIGSVWSAYMGDWFARQLAERGEVYKFGGERNKKGDIRHLVLDSQTYYGYTHEDATGKRVSNQFEFKGNMLDVLENPREITGPNGQKMYLADSMQTYGIHMKIGVSAKADPSRAKGTLSTSTLGLMSQFHGKLFDMLTDVGQDTRQARSARSLLNALALNRRSYHQDLPADVPVRDLTDPTVAGEHSDTRKKLEEAALNFPQANQFIDQALKILEGDRRLTVDALRVNVGGQEIFLPSMREISASLVKAKGEYTDNWASNALKLLTHTLMDNQSPLAAAGENDISEWAESVRYDLPNQANSSSFLKRLLGISFENKGWGGIAQSAPGLPENSVMVSRETFKSSLWKAGYVNLAKNMWADNDENPINKLLKDYLGTIDSDGLNHAIGIPFDENDPNSRKKLLDSLAKNTTFRNDLIDFFNRSGKEGDRRSGLREAVYQEAKRRAAVGETVPFIRYPLFNPEQTVLGANILVYEPDEWAKAAEDPNGTDETRLWGKAMLDWAQMNGSPGEQSYVSPDLLMTALGDLDGDRVAVLGSLMAQAAAKGAFRASDWKSMTPEDIKRLLMHTVGNELEKSAEEVYSDPNQNATFAERVDAISKQMAMVANVSSDPNAFLQKLIDQEFGGRGNIGKVYNQVLRRFVGTAQNDMEAQGADEKTMATITQAIGIMHSLGAQKLVDLSSIENADEGLANVLDVLNLSIQKQRNVEGWEPTKESGVGFRIYNPTLGRGKIKGDKIVDFKALENVTLGNILTMGVRTDEKRDYSLSVTNRGKTRAEILDSLPKGLRDLAKDLNDSDMFRVADWANYTAMGSIPLALGSKVIGSLETKGRDSKAVIREIIDQIGLTMFEKDGDTVKVRDLDTIRGEAITKLREVLKTQAPDIDEQLAYDTLNFALGNAHRRATNKMKSQGAKDNWMDNQLRIFFAKTGVGKSGNRFTYEQIARTSAAIEGTEQYRQGFEKRIQGAVGALTGAMSSFAPPRIRKYVEKLIPETTRNILSGLRTGSLFQSEEDESWALSPSVRSAKVTSDLHARMWGIFAPLSEEQQQNAELNPAIGSTGAAFRPEEKNRFGPSPSYLGKMFSGWEVAKKQLLGKTYEDATGLAKHVNFRASGSPAKRRQVYRMLETAMLTAMYHVPQPAISGHDAYKKGASYLFNQTMWAIRDLVGSEKVDDPKTGLFWRKFGPGEGSYRFGEVGEMPYERIERQKAFIVNSETGEFSAQAWAPEMRADGSSSSDAGRGVEAGLRSAYQIFNAKKLGALPGMPDEELLSLTDEDRQTAGGFIPVGKGKSVLVGSGEVDFIMRNAAGNVRVADSKAMQLEKLINIIENPESEKEYAVQQLLYHEGLVNELTQHEAGKIDEGDLSGAARNLVKHGVKAKDFTSPALIITGQMYERGKDGHENEMSAVSGPDLFDSLKTEMGDEYLAAVKTQEILLQRKRQAIGALEERARVLVGDGMKKDDPTIKRLADARTNLIQQVRSVQELHKNATAGVPIAREKILAIGGSLPDYISEIDLNSDMMRRARSYLGQIPERVLQYRQNIVGREPQSFGLAEKVAHNLAAALAPNLRQLFGRFSPKKSGGEDLVPVTAEEEERHAAQMLARNREVVNASGAIDTVSPRNVRYHAGMPPTPPVSWEPSGASASKKHDPAAGDVHTPVTPLAPGTAAIVSPKGESPHMAGPGETPYNSPLTGEGVKPAGPTLSGSPAAEPAAATAEASSSERTTIQFGQGLKWVRPNRGGVENLSGNVQMAARLAIAESDRLAEAFNKLQEKMGSTGKTATSVSEVFDNMATVLSGAKVTPEQIAFFEDVQRFVNNVTSAHRYASSEQGQRDEGIEDWMESEKKPGEQRVQGIVAGAYSFDRNEAVMDFRTKYMVEGAGPAAKIPQAVRQIRESEDPDSYMRAALFGHGRHNAQVRRELAAAQRAAPGGFRSEVTSKDEDYYRLEIAGRRLSPGLTEAIGSGARLMDRTSNFMWLTQHAGSYLMTPQFQSAMAGVQAEQTRLNALAGIYGPGTNMGAYAAGMGGIASFEMARNRALYGSMFSVYGTAGSGVGSAMGQLSFPINAMLAGGMVGSAFGPAGALAGGIIGGIGGTATSLASWANTQNPERMEILLDSVRYGSANAFLSNPMSGLGMGITPPTTDELRLQYAFQQASTGFRGTDFEQAVASGAVAPFAGEWKPDYSGVIGLYNDHGPLNQLYFGYPQTLQGGGPVTPEEQRYAEVQTTRDFVEAQPGFGADTEQAIAAERLANRYFNRTPGMSAESSLVGDYKDFFFSSIIRGLDPFAYGVNSQIAQGQLYISPQEAEERTRQLSGRWIGFSGMHPEAQIDDYQLAVDRAAQAQGSILASRAREVAGLSPIGIWEHEQVATGLTPGQMYSSGADVAYSDQAAVLYATASLSRTTGSRNQLTNLWDAYQASMPVAQREAMVWASQNYLALEQPHAWASATGQMSPSDWDDLKARFTAIQSAPNRGDMESLFQNIAGGNAFAITSAWQQGILRNDPRFNMVNMQTGMNTLYSNPSPIAQMAMAPNYMGYANQADFLTNPDIAQYREWGQRELQREQFGLQRQQVLETRRYRNEERSFDYAMTTGNIGGANSIMSRFGVTLEKSNTVLDALGKRLGVNTAGGLGQWQQQDLSRLLGREQSRYALEQEGRQQELQGQDLQRSLRQFMESFGLNQRQFQYQTGFQRKQIQFEREMQLTERGWQAQDLSLQRDQLEIGFAWQQEDFDRGIRYSRGREKRDLMRQQQRSVIQYAMQMTNQQRQETRFGTRNEWADELYKRTKENFEQMTKFTEEEMELNKKHFLENLGQDKKRFELAQEYHQKQLGWFTESAALQDYSIQQERSLYEIQYQRASEQIATFDSIEDSMTGIALRMQAISEYLAEQKGHVDAQVASLEIFKTNVQTTTDAVTDMSASTLQLAGSSVGIAVAAAGAGAAVGGLNGLVGSLVGLVGQFASAINQVQSRAASAGSWSGGGTSGPAPIPAPTPTLVPLPPPGASDWRRRATQYAEGGYTGDGPKYKPVDAVVHAGEYVVPQEGALVKSDRETLDVLREIARALHVIEQKDTSFSAVFNGVSDKDSLSFFEKSRARL